MLQAAWSRAGPETQLLSIPPGRAEVSFRWMVWPWNDPTFSISAKQSLLEFRQPMLLRSILVGDVKVMSSSVQTWDGWLLGE